MKNEKGELKNLVLWDVLNRCTKLNNAQKEELLALIPKVLKRAEEARGRVGLDIAFSTIKMVFVLMDMVKSSGKIRYISDPQIDSSPHKERKERIYGNITGLYLDLDSGKLNVKVFANGSPGVLALFMPSHMRKDLEASLERGELLKRIQNRFSSGTQDELMEVLDEEVKNILEVEKEKK